MGAEYNGRGRPSEAVPEAGRRLHARLAGGPPLLFDGATGTELELRGVPSRLPLWSAHALLEAPDTVAAVHRAYAEAGAEVIIANTFRTQGRTLASAGLEARAAELTARAAELARRSGADFVAGSAPPLEDCYRPERVPPDHALRREHAEHARNLAAAGVDFVLAETLGCVREARAAARAAREAGLACIASFVCWEPARLLSGERLQEGLEAAAEEGAVAVGVNCLPTGAVEPCLAALTGCGLAFGVQPNLGPPLDERGAARRDARTPEQLADDAAPWVAAGARFLGGCCGTRPAHVRELARRFGAGSTA